MNRDFAEMLAALSAAGAEFLIVGAHALAAHGTPRATGDLDIWDDRLEGYDGDGDGDGNGDGDGDGNGNGNGNGHDYGIGRV